MAGAEARALWQRTANRCFVQEDAKRAPKLACCQSSCATSKLVDMELDSTADESDHTTVNVTQFNRKSSVSNLSSDSRWWLHLQPNYGCQKGLTYEQLNALDEEVETLIASDVSKNSQEFQELMNVMAKHEIVDVECVGCSESSMKSNEFSLESDYSWIESDTAEPWWRTTDRDELASFVSHKSLNHIENCDLPPQQKKHLRGYPCARMNNCKTRTGNLDSALMHKNQWPSAREGLLYFASDKCSSDTPKHEDVKRSEHIFDENPSKAQLMEALCHSQTRAREAEEAAKKAYAEKEHIVTLIFKQASQLFAYKQWLQLLQLETLYSQIKNKDQPISTLFPVALPWMSYEGRISRKRKQKISNPKQERQVNAKCDITTYVVAFALGLSLVGAGLLLGWTMGWMLPRS
ncbi:uncharacterized protein LOC114188237 [Vigna unguiculata]|uniref:Uncharacterized protein n=1 Tax=Vigna unguiculata TaxID=3917 RepID=A0A4D6KM25_VIGUN|nr:uncharacterized protein LOC114188237 [Vigna unguiculata]QCD77513.1 hypothetical protein DEO72_LG1g1138 [Vigna unguiculata]